jgi:hypothetical protein
MERDSDVLRFPWSRILFAVAMVALVTAIACYILFERFEDIDLNSGRLRFQTAVGPIVLSEEIEDSTFSKLMGDSSNERVSPIWGHVNAVGVLGVHGRYGYAFSELRRFVTVCEDLHIDLDRRRTLGRRLLELMRHEQFPEMAKLIDELRESPVGGTGN